MRAIPTLLQLLDADWVDDARLTPHDLRSLQMDIDRLERDGVIVASSPVNHIETSCDVCSQHEVVPIEMSDPPVFHEVCPIGEGGPVTPDELRTWTVDPKGIAALLADAIDSDHDAETILPGKAWRIGVVRVGDETFAIVFATARGAERLADRKDASRMVVVGNRVSHDAFAGTLPIGDVFDFSTESITAKPGRLEQAIPFTDRPVGNAFYRKGQVWVVRFDGNETFLENNVGPLYIARLLATPHMPVPAVTLLASRIGIDERKLTGSSGELADAEAVADCQRRYEDLMNEIAKAESDNDIGRLDQLKAEQDDLTSHLASVLGKGGRRREVTDADKIRQSVTKAIKRTLAVLEAEHQPLAKHLSASLSLGYAPMYSPANETDWQT